MPLSAGTRLGPYEILAPIGAGGMGEVWKARDTRLDRTVAVKTSAEQFTDRFEREAHAVAALNHPNICQLYDVGPNYLVMELVDGERLKGPLPVEKAVAYAGQILDALDAAHKKGITHRDLKPANILVTKQGIKLLDFGLAKQATGLKESDATLSNSLTAQGQILGTLQYMSPEQLQGKEADARSDLFAFGCVLYEMLTGKRAFEGASTASLIAAILEREPAPLTVAPPLDRVIRRCLAKDPDERFQTARDLKFNLLLAMEREPSTAVASRPMLPWIVAASLIVVAAIAIWSPWRPPRAADSPMLQVDLDLGPNEVSEPAISADGLRIAFVSRGHLAVRRLDQTKTTVLAGTERASSPFFSPDGQWVAYFASSKLQKIAVDGGAPVPLCEAPNGSGGSWGEDGMIVAALSNAGCLFRIPAAGGVPTPLTILGESETNHLLPQVLPGGKGVLFTSLPSSIKVLSAAGGEPKTLIKNAVMGRYLASGQLVYYHGSSLFAAPIDLDRLEVTGPAVPLVEGVADKAMVGAQFEVSPSGTLVYVRGKAPQKVLSWLNSSGEISPLLPNPGIYFTPRLSPDGRRVALAVAQLGQQNLWIYDIARDIMTPLTSDSEFKWYPTWTPDGEFLAFHTGSRLAWIRADGSGKAEKLAGLNAFPMSFSPDGRRLVFFQNDSRGHFALGIVPVERAAGTMQLGRPEILLQQPGFQAAPAISPDGRWLAYYSDEAGSRQVFVRPLPPAGPLVGSKWQVSNGGGRRPLWSRNGRELFFESPLDNRMMVASYTIRGDAFVVEKPRQWSARQFPESGARPSFDLAPDGKRVAVLLDAPGEEKKPETHLRVLLNVGDELRRRAKGGGGAK